MPRDRTVFMTDVCSLVDPVVERGEPSEHVGDYNSCNKVCMQGRGLKSEKGLPRTKYSKCVQGREHVSSKSEEVRRLSVSEM